MDLSSTDRMSALLLAQTIASNRMVLDLRGELQAYVRRLNKYQIFTVKELSDISKLSEYKVRRAISGDNELNARAGISPRHLDHALRMVSSQTFTKQHIKSLVEDGARFSALARVTGISERSLRYWYGKE